MTEQKTEPKTAVEVAEEKLSNARKEYAELKNRYTIKGAKVSIGKVYANLYKKDLTENEKIKAFFVGVEKVKDSFNDVL